jgi:biotin carboxyl carrier protein
MTKEVKKTEEFSTLTLWDSDYKTLLTTKFINRKKYVAENPKLNYSFIPGTIQEILIKEGQKMKKGEPMLILESMKMMNIIRVPVDGKVKKIHIKVGERIPKNHLMVEFE